MTACVCKERELSREEDECNCEDSEDGNEVGHSGEIDVGDVSTTDSERSGDHGGYLAECDDQVFRDFIRINLTNASFSISFKFHFILIQSQ